MNKIENACRYEAWNPKRGCWVPLGHCCDSFQAGQQFQERFGFWPDAIRLADRLAGAVAVTQKGKTQ